MNARSAPFLCGLVAFSAMGCGDEASPVDAGTDAGPGAGPAAFATGLASGSATFDAAGCLPNGLELETDRGVRALVPPGSCFRTRLGEPLSGEWGFGLDSEGAVELNDAGMRLLGAVRFRARPAGASDDVPVVSTSSITLEVELGDPGQGAFYAYGFSGDPLGEILTPEAPTDRTPYVHSALLPVPGPESVVIDGSQTVGFAFFRPSGQALRPAQVGGPQEVRAALPASFDAFPHICSLQVVNNLTADIVFATAETIRRVDGQVELNSYFGPYGLRLTGSSPREIILTSPYSNTFVFQAVACDDEEELTGGAAEQLLTNTQGGSVDELETAGRYVGRIKLDFIGPPGWSASDAFEALDLVRNVLPPSAVLTLHSYEQGSERSTAASSFRYDERSTQLIAEAIPSDWTATRVSNRVMEVTVPSNNATHSISITGGGATVSASASGVFQFNGEPPDGNLPVDAGEGKMRTLEELRTMGTVADTASAELPTRTFAAFDAMQSARCTAQSTVSLTEPASPNEPLIFQVSMSTMGRVSATHTYNGPPTSYNVTTTSNCTGGASVQFEVLEGRYQLEVTGTASAVSSGTQARAEVMLYLGSATNRVMIDNDSRTLDETFILEPDRPQPLFVNSANELGTNRGGGASDGQTQVDVTFRLTPIP